MPDAKISALPAAGSIVGTELFAIVQDGVTKRAAISSIPSGGGESVNSFKWLGDYAGATSEAKLDALIATLVHGDTVVIPAGTITITTQKTITGINGLI